RRSDNTRGGGRGQFVGDALACLIQSRDARDEIYSSGGQHFFAAAGGAGGRCECHGKRHAGGHVSVDGPGDLAACFVGGDGVGGDGVSGHIRGLTGGGRIHRDRDGSGAYGDFIDGRHFISDGLGSRIRGKGALTGDGEQGCQ